MSKSAAPSPMRFQVEQSSFCPSGIAPRWSWWIRGIAGTERYGIVGTDEQGRGLYLYEYSGDQKPQRCELLDASTFSLTGTLAKAEALHILANALTELGWGVPHELQA